MKIDRYVNNYIFCLIFEFNCNVDINVILKVLCIEGYSIKININLCKFILDKVIFFLSME